MYHGCFSRPAIVLSVMFLCSLSRAEMPERILQVWDEEYNELAGQIKRLENWNGVPRDRLQAETLDQQALTLPEDKHPLDIVLRRTAALLQYYKQRGQLDSSLLDDFAKQLNELSAAAESTASADEQKTLSLKPAGCGEKSPWPIPCSISTASFACWNSRATPALSSRRGHVGEGTPPAEDRSLSTTSSPTTKSRNSWTESRLLPVPGRARN